MSEERYKKVTELVSLYDKDKISFEEFDRLVSDQEYEEWSFRTNSSVLQEARNLWG